MEGNLQGTKPKDDSAGEEYVVPAAQCGDAGGRARDSVVCAIGCRFTFRARGKSEGSPPPFLVTCSSPRRRTSTPISCLMPPLAMFHERRNERTWNTRMG